VEAYTTILQSSQIYINKIYNAMTQISMDQYNIIPLTMALFQPPLEEKRRVERSSWSSKVQ
jgi:hypothetical protein